MISRSQGETEHRAFHGSLPGLWLLARPLPQHCTLRQHSALVANLSARALAAEVDVFLVDIALTVSTSNLRQLHPSNQTFDSARTAQTWTKRLLLGHTRSSSVGERDMVKMSLIGFRPKPISFGNSTRQAAEAVSPSLMCIPLNQQAGGYLIKAGKLWVVLKSALATFPLISPESATT